MKNPQTYIVLQLFLLAMITGCGLRAHAERAALATETTARTDVPTAHLTATPAANPESIAFTNAPAVTDAPPSVHLPTITPTPIPPGQSPLATPTDVLPILTPVIYPQLTPYSLNVSDTVFRGIAYIERTDAGFGRMSFINSISPCLCQTEQNGYACARIIEEYLLSKPTEGIVRAEACLSIELGDGRMATFTDDSGSSAGTVVRYTYEEALPEVGYHLLHMWFWEGSSYLLLDAFSGATTMLTDYPVFSPDNRHFAVVTHPSFSRALQIWVWRLEDDGPVLEQGWRTSWSHPEIQEYGRGRTIWTSKEAFRISWPEQKDLPPIADITVAQEANEWAVRYGNELITQPVVEPRSIMFALASSMVTLDTLEAGRPVYTDRDYHFTSVPPELAGQTFFGIPQHYYLGEEPDYFPEKLQMADYLQFQVTMRAYVYVGLDAQFAQRPDWMDVGWEAVDLELETDDVPLQLYRRTYEAGDTVGLVSKWMLPNRVPSQFVVVVTPAQ